MKTVVSVVGKDSMGIVALVSTKCAALGANILDISQSILDDYFAMIMLINMDKLNVEFTEFVDEMEALGKTNGLEIHVMHEDLFNSMHKI
ncbi:MAG: ACT domain-containing protein [Clostridia bacterium]|nr:ACT domain-containing protein [Clostridia bacterium]